MESIEDLLELSDIVSIHTPLNDETMDIIDGQFVRNMKQGASIVNTARGGLFADLDILYDALIENQLYSLAIDVLEIEPPEPCRLINAWRDLSNELQGRIIINPHTSYYSQASIKEMRINAARNALRMYRNETPYNLINE